MATAKTTAKKPAAKKASSKKTTPSLEWNTSTIDGSIYHKENARKFIQKLYKKTFTGYWMADLA